MEAVPQVDVEKAVAAPVPIISRDCCPSHLIRITSPDSISPPTDSIPGVVHIKKFETAIGRERNAVDVHLDSAKVPRMISRIHAYLVYSHHQWKVRDNRSVNGVFVNDRKVHEAILQDGDIVVFGGGGNRPIGAILPQDSSEFRYVFQSNPFPPAQLVDEVFDDESEEETVMAASPTPITPNLKKRKREDLQEGCSDDLESDIVSKKACIVDILDDARSHDFETVETQEEDEGFSSEKYCIVSSTESVDMISAHSSVRIVENDEKEVLNKGQEVEIIAGLTENERFHDSRTLQPLREVQTSILLNRERREPKERVELKEWEQSEEARLGDFPVLVKRGSSGELLDRETVTRIAQLQKELKEACEERDRGSGVPVEMVPSDSELICKICRDVLFNPTSLPCKHTFCDDCIESLILQAPYCPLCGSEELQPIVRNGEVEVSVVELLRGWSDAQRSEWAENMTKRNESLRAAKLKLMLECSKARGHKFLHISERWNDQDRRKFLDGIDQYCGASKVVYGRAVGLTEFWIASASTSDLIAAIGNLGLSLSTLVARVRPVNGVRSNEAIDDAFRGALRAILADCGCKHQATSSPSLFNFQQHPPNHNNNNNNNPGQYPRAFFPMGVLVNAAGEVQVQVNVNGAGWQVVLGNRAPIVVALGGGNRLRRVDQHHHDNHNNADPALGEHRNN